MKDLNIGIDIGGTKVLCLAMQDLEAKPERQPLPADANSLLELLVELVMNQIGAASNSKPEKITLGIGCAGSIDFSGKVWVSPNITYLNGINLKEKLQEKLKTQATDLESVIVVNDVFAATTAELTFGNKPMEDFIFLAFGTGIGGGRVIGGKQYAGANNFWGEVGHIFICEQEMEVCGCGQTGCWEQMASGKALTQVAKKLQNETPNLTALKKNISGIDIGEILSSNLDPESPLRKEALLILEEIVLWMARGIKNLINVCDPGDFVLGGGLMKLGDEIMNLLQREIPNCELKLATNLDLGVAMGAAHLGKQIP